MAERPLELPSGLKIDRPRRLILAFVDHWYEMYDGVHVAQDNQLRASDIALSTMLMSRISGVTAGYILRIKAPIEDGLTRIPANLDLLDAGTDTDIPGAKGIGQAITAACTVPRAKLAVSTKILHKKRPGLIPILDSFVANHYAPQCPSDPNRSWGDYALALTRLIHRDMLSASSQLRDLQEELAENKTPMTACRILNALTWTVKSGGEKWILQQPVALKQIRQMPLEFSTDEKVVEYVEKVVQHLVWL